jgi:hypothetical protein
MFSVLAADQSCEMTNSTDYPESAILQVRSCLPGDNPRQVPCSVGAMVHKRLTLISRERIPVATTVSVEHNDALLLGEIVACTQDCERSWHLELKVEHVLTGLQSLMVLRQRLVGDSAAARMRPMAAVAQ